VAETQEQKKRHAEMARTRFQNGVATEVDVLRSDVAVANGAPDLVRADNSIRQARALVNYYLGRPLDFATRIAADFEEKPWENTEVADLEREAMRRRPELLRLRIAERSAATQIKLAQAENRMRADFSSSYGMSARLPQNLVNSKFVRWTAGVSFTFPIFDGFKRSGLAWQATDPSKITYYQVKLDLRAFITPIPPEITEHTFEDVPDGYHTLTVIAYDGAGNSTSRSVNVIVDTVYPKVDILSPANGTGFAHSDVDVIWTGLGTEDDIKGFEVWSNGVKLATTTNITPFFHFTDLNDGHYSVTIKAFDQASNAAMDNVTFFVDTIEPALVSCSPEGDQVAASSLITATFSKEMDQSATTISVGGVTGTVTWDGPNATFAPSTPLAFGTAYTATIVGKDTVGNNVSKVWTFTTTNLGTVTGVVVDNNGNPVGGVSVSMDGGTPLITNERGEFTFTADAGPHNLTLSKGGWDGKTVAVTVLPGQSVGLASISVTPTNPLAIYGIIAAVAGVAIVALLIYFNRRKKEKGPPARSWKGMEEMQKRANKGNKRREEDDEEEELL
jgi:hypothetical protein